MEKKKKNHFPLKDFFHADIEGYYIFEIEDQKKKRKEAMYLQEGEKISFSPKDKVLSGLLVC